MAKKTVNERTTSRYTANLTDDAGAAVSSTQLDSLTLTLYNVATTAQTIINGRDGQNVLNANNVTVGSTGALVWSMQAQDNIIVDTTTKRSRAEEHHVALFAWQWGGSTGNLGRHKVDIYVQDCDKTT